MTSYGAAVKPLWPLEEGMIFLNHGSYGACPHAVLAEQARLRLRLESQPCRFINTEAPPALRAAAAQLAAFVGAAPDDLGFVENTTSGINAIIGSLAWNAGDEVIVTDHVYNAVRNTLRHVLDRHGATLKVVPVGLPVAGPEAVVDAVVGAVGPATRLVVLDHVASVSGVVFPVAEIAAGCAAKGVDCLIDGAHAPGMLDLDVPATGAAYYVGNCHKWLCAPKGAAFVWARADRQAGLHPTVISHDLGRGFAAEFDKIGTRDQTAWLAVPAALAFHEELGGAALRQRNHDVVVEAATALAARFGTRMGAPAAMFGSLATIRLPEGLPADRATADALKAHLWRQHRAEVHIMPFVDALWLRLSVQAYNELSECLAVGPMVEEAMAAVAAERLNA